MEFKEFANKLGSVIKGSENTSRFTKTLFESIVPEEYYESCGLEGKSSSSYAGYYNGNVKITKISQDICMHADVTLFADFIEQQSDTACAALCKAFQDDFEETLDDYNVGEKLADLFHSIIVDAAKQDSSSTSSTAGVSSRAITPDITRFSEAYFNSGSSIQKGLENLRDALSMFTNRSLNTYIKKSCEHYDNTKLLLYSDPKPFYDIYIPNEVIYNDFNKNRIKNVSIKKLSTITNFAIISGTGGIGKSMMMKHLFFGSADAYKENPEESRIPILIPLKDYIYPSKPLSEYAMDQIKNFYEIDTSTFYSFCESGKFVFLFDGLDEITDIIRDDFERALDKLVMKYPSNYFVLSSRPTSAFTSFSRFTVFTISPFSKEQALELINKLEYWDEDAKKKFLTDLDKKLYQSHTEFASNPLLLTIMLMTYSDFGEIPEKMHVFYAKAYETMAREHDANKGAYKRPMHTGLSPEQFAVFFSEFCARTYRDGKLEFSKEKFAAYMDKVIEHQKIHSPTDATAKDFLDDLTDNLCIMYKEGEKYYFIHRSFQEYFAARFFVNQPDESFSTTAQMFEQRRMPYRFDLTLPMMYDMIPARMDRFVFMPLLKKIISESDERDGYWTFLLSQYPEISARVGDCGMWSVTLSESTLYDFYIHAKSGRFIDIDDMEFPDSAKEFVDTEYAYINDHYLDSDGVSYIFTDDMSLVNVDEIPEGYIERFGYPDVVGVYMEISIAELLENRTIYSDMISFFEDPEFPFMEEYMFVKKLVAEYDEAQSALSSSDDIFDSVYE